MFKVKGLTSAGFIIILAIIGVVVSLLLDNKLTMPDAERHNDCAAKKNSYSR